MYKRQATITRTSAQTYIISTAGNARSVFFWRKVLAGRRTVTEGRPSRSCYLEWSLPDDAHYHDPEQWAQYLPALGHSIKAAKLATRLDKALANPDEVDDEGYEPGLPGFLLSLIHISEPTRRLRGSRMPSSA